MKIVHKHFPTMAMGLEIPEVCVEKAKIVLDSESESNSPSDAVTPDQIEKGKITLMERQKQNEKLYLNLLNSLMETVEKNNL